MQQNRASRPGGRTGRGASPYDNRIAAAQRRRRLIRNVILLVTLAAIAAAVVLLLVNPGKSSNEVGATRLTCYADQDVTPFGDNLLYYDGASIHCLADSGAIRWSFSVGSNASFHCSDNCLVIWQGNQLYIVDSSGRSTYNEALSEEIQFARAGTSYVAIVTGSDTNPDLVIRDLQGTQVDEEAEAYDGLLLLDVGFYGDSGEYMWTMAMDVYSTALNTVMNTFQVGKMNTGEASLGEKLVYKVLYENSKLRVFTTQQLYTYDYKLVQDTNSTILVYGWEYLDSYLPSHGDATLLLSSTTNQTGSSRSVSELRLLSGTNTDRRYTLPKECVGAMVNNRSIYAFASDTMYRVDISSQVSYAYASPLPEGESIDGFLGKTNSGKAILTSGDSVFIVTLPD